MGVKNEGAGRVQMRNGGRMSLRSYKETMADKFGPIDPPKKRRQYDDDLDDVYTEIKGDITDIQRLLKKLAEERKQQRPATYVKPAAVVKYASEADLWK